MKGIPHWIIVNLVLFGLSLFCCCALKGYSYLGYTFLFIAALITCKNLLPAGMFKTLLALVCVGLMYFCIIEIPIIASSKGDKDSDRRYLVVLGAEVVGTRPSRSLNYRIQEAFRYLSEHPASIAILSGGKGATEHISEAQCMFDCLSDMGIDPDRLIIEDKSTSTMENLHNSFSIIRELGNEPSGNTAILSSSYHLYRAKKMSLLQDVEAVGVPCYPGNPFLALNFFIREAFGVTQLIVLGK